MSITNKTQNNVLFQFPIFGTIIRITQYIVHEHLIKGIAIEKKKIIDTQNGILSLKTHYWYIQYPKKFRLGHIVRHQILQKTD